MASTFWTVSHLRRTPSKVSIVLADIMAQADCTYARLGTKQAKYLCGEKTVDCWDRPTPVFARVTVTNYSRCTPSLCYPSWRA